MKSIKYSPISDQKHTAPVSSVVVTNHKIAQFSAAPLEVHILASVLSVSTNGDSKNTHFQICKIQLYLNKNPLTASTNNKHRGLFSSNSFIVIKIKFIV